MLYCVVPRPLEDELFDRLTEYYKDEPNVEVIVDRLSVKESSKRRLTDSVETALGLAGGVVVLEFVDLPETDPNRERRYSERLACPNDHPLSIEELEPRSFSFNSPYGACPTCTGLGTRLEADPELIVPDPASHGRDVVDIGLRHHRRHGGIDVTGLELVAAMRLPQGGKVMGHGVLPRHRRPA